MVNGSFTPEQRMKIAASMDAENVIREYDSRLEGHYNEEITTSRIKYGKNEVTNHNKHVVLKRLYHAFVNVFIIALTIIDILWPVTAIAESWSTIYVDGQIIVEEMINCIDWVYVVILTTLILVSGTMTFVQETRSSKAASKLVSMVTTIITVRREGVEIEIDSKELVVGDIIILDTGDVIPADVRIIKSNHLKVDQSALTGESGSVTKYGDSRKCESSVLGCDNLAFSGTNVVGGSAEAIVIAVGDETIFGSMAEKLTMKTVDTTYDKGIKSITSVLVKLMVYMVPPVFIIMVVKGYMNGGEPATYLFEAFLFALTLAIGLMPEMLATIVSTNLAKGAIDMSKNKVIVKDVNSIQNFGAMDVLCSDKTGTLTQNRISVLSCNDVYGNPSGFIERITCLNSRNLTSATNQIDWAIDEYADENVDLEVLESYQFVGDVPFDFVRRRSTVIVQKSEDVNVMITKGAVPEILSISSGYLDANKEIQPIDDKITAEIMGLVEWYSVKGMRVLGITHKFIPVGQTEFSSDDENDLIFAGFVVFTDPVKESAGPAIKDMHDYGIAVKVLTGDNEYVTRYVCDEIGVDTTGMLVGSQIDAMSDEELKAAVETSNVFVRLTPDNKSRIVLALRANGHTVGFMGDGINDVIAMRNADVSISVDIGSDIAKETANMILLEKDLGILKNGAIEGRKVYVNSIKYVKMIGSINFGYMFSLILASLLFNFEPMGAIMILIFNLINDFACLVIPWDKVEDEFVREPRKWDAINLKSVMFRYGPMCPLTDIMTWLFMIFVIFPTITNVVSADGTVYGTLTDAIVQFADMSGTSAELLFESIWCIEQYWMQVWSIHIVRTNKLPFFQAWSSKILVVTTIIALAVGTILPFTGDFWAGIASFTGEMIPIPLWALLWMPFIACVYFFGSHLIKKRMLRTQGYFAC